MRDAHLICLKVADRTGTRFVACASSDWTVAQLKTVLCAAAFGQKGELRLRPREIALSLCSVQLADQRKLSDYTLVRNSVVSVRVIGADDRKPPGHLPKWLSDVELSIVSCPLAMVGCSRKADGELVAEAFQEALEAFGPVDLQQVGAWTVDGAGDGKVARRVLAVLQRELCRKAQDGDEDDVDDEAELLPLRVRRPPIGGDCVPHSVHDAIKGLMRRYFAACKHSSGTKSNDVMSRSIESACALLRKLLTEVQQSGVVVEDCAETRWGSHARGALQLAVAAPFLAQVFKTRYGITGAEDLKQLDWKERRTYLMLTEAPLRLTLFILGELHYYLCQPLLDWANACSSLRFDQIGAKVLELGAASLMTPSDRRDFFPNSYAFACAAGFAASDVDAIVTKHVANFMRYMLNRLDLVRRAPYCYTFFFSPEHRQRLAQSLVAALEAYERGEGDLEAFEFCDTLGFRESDELAAALREVAAGGPLPRVLHKRDSASERCTRLSSVDLHVGASPRPTARSRSVRPPPRTTSTSASSSTR